MRGCISKRKNGTYAYTIEIGKVNGKRKQQMKAGFVTKKEAEAALAQVLSELGRGSYIEETKETVQEYFTKFLTMKRPNLRPGTVKTYKWLINYHIIPQLGQIPLVKLTPHHLVTMYETLRVEKKLSPQTVNHIHKVIHEVLLLPFGTNRFIATLPRLSNRPKYPRPK